MANGTPLSRQSGPPYRLHLKHHLCPGDVLVMTAAIESLHVQYPGQYRVSVDTTFPEIWQNNPRIESIPAHDCHVIDMAYPAINEANLIKTGHFMQAFTSFLGEQISKPLQLQVNHPSIYLSDEEKANRVVETDRPYLVVNAGVKSDFTTKGWGHSNYQRVVDALRDRVDFVQIGELSHDHQPLEGAVNLIGKTTIRQLFQVCYQSIGGLGPTTFLGHTMASLERFYVCILGGREPLTWCHYPTQRTFSVQGCLPCCSPSACWKSRTVALNDGNRKDSSLCSLPVLNKGGEMVPACMDSIKPEEVINAIEIYLNHRK